MLTLFKDGHEHEWLASFRVKTPLRTRYSEIDSYGHVSNVVYAEYLETGRMDYLKIVGDPEPRTNIFAFEHVCAELHLRFMQACYFDEALFVHTKLAGLGGSSATFQQAITGGTPCSLRAIATAVIVHNDGNSTKPWSRAQRAALGQFDGVSALHA